MVIREKNNFIPLMTKMLIGLGYEEVKTAGKESAADITASKDGKKYCFKCRYDIDAIGEKYITEYYDGVKDAGYDVLVFMTNSSFISAAKKKAEAVKMELWDRNTIDRFYVSVADKVSDDFSEPEKESGKGLFIGLVIAGGVLVLFLLYWFVIRRFIG